MRSRMFRLVATGGFLVCVPALASAFQAADEITWPAAGTFPAYPPEPSDGRTVHFSAFSGLLHDSNLFRLSDTTAPLTAIGSTSKSDTVLRYGAGIDANLPVSRQKIRLNARIERRDYDRFGVLDHTAYALGAGWDWVAGSDWSGKVGYGRENRLSNLAEIQAPLKDMITSDHAYAGARYRLTSRWRARGALDWWKYDHGAPTRATLDNRTASGTVGVDYVTPAEDSIGGQFVYTDGRYPNQQPVATGAFVDNRYREYETSAVAHWVVTGKSSLDGRLGYTRREHDQVSQRDFSGFTGRLDYGWFVAAKTKLGFEAWREIRSYEDVTASYVVSRGGAFGPAWGPTDKVVVQARLVYDRRSFGGDPGFVVAGGPERRDTFRGIRVSGGWNPRRNMEFVISGERGDRDSNILGRDYEYVSWMANAKLRF